jgi:hypothetical protein
MCGTVNTIFKMSLILIGTTCYRTKRKHKRNNYLDITIYHKEKQLESSINRKNPHQTEIMTTNSMNTNDQASDN